MSKTIIFYAPVGTGVPVHMLGGGEKGCRRTQEILTNAGYKLITVDKPVMGNGAKQYILMAIKAYLKIIKSLLTNKSALLYVVGFYEKNVYLEWLILFTGKFLHHKTIYEARNGRLIKAYADYGKQYKHFMDSIIKKSDVIFAQGLEYIDFIKQFFGKQAVYTPNYVMNRNLLPYKGDRPFDTIKLLYFGRVSESKNIDVVLKVAGELEKRGYRTDTTVIGGYQEEYKKRLDELARKLKLNSVRFMGQQQFEVIRDELQRVHFFIFPSQEKMEGHSNSLTEAMTFGVVPVVSTAGFNASIVSRPELVVADIDYLEYADTVDQIVKDGTWREYSQFVYERVKKNYTEDRVRENILEAIAMLE